MLKATWLERAGMQNKSLGWLIGYFLGSLCYPGLGPWRPCPSPLCILTTTPPPAAFAVAQASEHTSSSLLPFLVLFSPPGMLCLESLMSESYLPCRSGRSSSAAPSRNTPLISPLHPSESFSFLPWDPIAGSHYLPPL